VLPSAPGCTVDLAQVYGLAPGTLEVVSVEHDAGTLKHIFGAQVTETPALLATTPAPLVIAALEETQPFDAFGGNDYLIGYRRLDSAHAADWWGFLIDRAGNILTPDAVALGVNQPWVTGGGGVFLIQWRDPGSTVYRAILDETGTLSAPIVTGTD